MRLEREKNALNSGHYTLPATSKGSARTLLGLIIYIGVWWVASGVIDMCTEQFQLCKWGGRVAWSACLWTFDLYLIVQGPFIIYNETECINKIVQLIYVSLFTHINITFK